MSASRGVFPNPTPEENRYRLLLKVTDWVARPQTFPDALKELAPSVLTLTGGVLLNLALYEPRDERMQTRYWKKNQASGECGAFSVDEAATGWAWKHQEPISIPDIERDERFPASTSALRNHGVRSYTVFPVSTHSHHFGALALGKTTPGTLDDEDLELLARVAAVGAVALEKERVQRALEEQQSLVAISRELSLNLDLNKLLPAILSSLRGIARYERAILSLLDPQGQNLCRYGDALQWERLVNDQSSIPVERSLAARTIRSHSISFLNADDLRQMDDPLARAMYEAGVRSVCSVPLIAAHRIWGTLNASTENANGYALSEVEYLQQVANQIAMAVHNAHSYQEIVELKERLVQEKRLLEYEVRSAGVASDDIVGQSASLKRVLDYASIVADTDSTVLITGETGTGKERIARLIHNLSRRKSCNFIKLNCAAIPTGLLESELFGHEKGAFTGAVSQKIGRLELADKGTLLLDEIGEIPLEIQPKLLRVLQDQEFERLGGTKTIRVDVRLIAATNRDLVRAVEERQFRSDLFYRLHVFPLHVPALRDRREDIPLLIHHFVEKCSARLHKRIEVIPDEAIRAMMQWRWPGNIRELENFIERSVILSESSRLMPPLGELREEISRQPAESEGTLRDRERQHIIEILRHTHGVLSGPTGAAARLGLKRTTLQYKMQRLGISRMDYLS